MGHFDNYIYIESIFRERQFKLTTQRRTVLDILLENIEKKLSAEEVHIILRKRATGIGLATVYRTLELLEELAILQKKDGGDGRSRYEVRNENKCQDTSHFVCVACGKAVSFANKAIIEQHCEMAEKESFQILHQQTKIYGYCRDCQ